MPIQKYRDSSAHITVFICEGEISSKDVIQAIKGFYDGTDGLPTKLVLWDLTNSITTNLSTDEIDEIAQIRLDHDNGVKDGKTAVVAPNDINFGMARMFQAKTAGSHREMMVFRTLKEAKIWLEDN